MSCTFIFPIYLLSLVLILIKSDRRDALKSIMAILGSVIPVRPQFFDSLASLDSLKLEGSLYIDLSIIASIPANLISESSYGDIAITVMVNSFEATASFGSTAFSIELPITLPSGRQVNHLNLTDATFSRDIYVTAPTSVVISQLFSEDQDAASINLDINGQFEAILPLTVGIAGMNIVVDFSIIDENVFESDPIVDYAIDLCDVSDTIMDLFDQLKDQIVAAVRAPFDDKPVLFVRMLQYIYLLEYDIAMN